MKPNNKGFTLLELMVVLFIMVLGFSIIGINLSSGNNATEHQRAARDIVSALRYARGMALMSHRETAVTFNLNENSYTVNNRDKVFTIPETIKVTVVTTQSQLLGQNQGSIRFFADGSSTGGRVSLKRGENAWQIDINWLTGQIELKNN
ncbi:MAG: GspH/FimT family pseudopilin [Methylococcaceae bacterium]|nr:GspH/FimT family pseudopilin [Methylococcaceae bacterium]